MLVPYKNQQESLKKHFNYHYQSSEIFALYILGDLGSIPGQVIPKTFKKMVLYTALLNTQ